MANFLRLWSVAGKAAFVPFVSQDQRVDVFEHCSCGHGCWISLKAGAELAAGVSQKFVGTEFCARLFMVWDFIKSHSCRCGNTLTVWWFVGFFFVCLCGVFCL